MKFTSWLSVTSFHFLPSGMINQTFFTHHLSRFPRIHPMHRITTKNPYSRTIQSHQHAHSEPLDMRMLHTLHSLAQLSQLIALARPALSGRVLRNARKTVITLPRSAGSAINMCYVHARLVSVLLESVWAHCTSKPS